MSSQSLNLQQLKAKLLKDPDTMQWYQLLKPEFDKAKSELTKPLKD